MCGIAGFSLPRGLDAQARKDHYTPPLTRMIASLHHRGPDALRGILLDGIALGHTRLSIVDLSGGHQPMRDPLTGLTVVFNGEIFNHVELRERLSGSYAFRTRSDTEVILAAFLAWGMGCVREFVGQFAFALWDPRDHTLWLARDRVGVRPLFYASTPEGIAFASEAKALFASGQVKAALDEVAVSQAIGLWTPVSPRSFFAGVSALPPGSTACVRGRKLEISRYWDIPLSPDSTLANEQVALEALTAQLKDAVRLRLRADVPVAAYLSGGLDSSLLCALAQEQLGGTLQTFSVRFAEDRYDEGKFQQEVSQALKTQHHIAAISNQDIGECLPTVVDHAEAVLLRSAPAPFYKLSQLVREHRTKVVLTGEGADEILWGYDLFKETKVRAFWARSPRSNARPALFRRLYPYLPLNSQSPEMLREFFGEALEQTQHPLYSHLIRFSNSGRIRRFFSSPFLARVHNDDGQQALIDSLPPYARQAPPLARAQYLEIATLLSGYLLSSQGDRMLMSNSVEGRFPFLDHRVIELAARIPGTLKLRGLTEKFILRKVAQGRVPETVWTRTKFPYRAPIAETLTGPKAPEWAKALLGAKALADVGIFDERKVPKLVEKLSSRSANAPPPSEADNMALMAIASTQLLATQFTQPRVLREEDVKAVVLEAA